MIAGATTGSKFKDDYIEKVTLLCTHRIPFQLDSCISIWNDI